MLLSFAPSTQAQEPTPTVPPPLLGDVDCSGRVHLSDSEFILWLDAGLSDSLPCGDAGDVNNDGMIDTVDAALIQQIYALGTPFPTPPEPLPPPASGEVAIGSSSDVAASQRTVSLRARSITTPGLGAWTIDVEYDPVIVAVVRCSPNSESVCNANFANRVLRLSGAWPGLEGDTELASLTFRCRGVGGVSDLTLNPRIFADATIGGPQPINPTLTNGSIACADTLSRRLTVLVIHDLNGNGRRDPGEPGLAGWTVDLPDICGKLGTGEEAQSGVTDGQGQVVFPTRTYRCVVVESRFGWVFTTDRPQRTNIGPREEEALVLVRKIGQQLHVVTGRVIVDGLPATDGTRIDALVGGNSCGDVDFRPYTAVSSYMLHVLGEADRPGCASEGESVVITVGNVPVGEVTFASGQSSRLDLIAGPVPMWFEGVGRLGPQPVVYVGSLVCGEARLFQSFGFHTYTVYVFPDALRPGCGAPGRIVTLRIEDEVLLQAVWQAGFVPFDELQDVELPIVGAFAPTSGSRFSLTDGGGARIYATALALLGLLLLSGGAVVLRRRRTG